MQKWPWKIYGIFLTVLIVASLTDMASKDSALRMYYTMLIAFHRGYGVLLVLNIISLIINLLAPLVVFCYAFNVKSSLKFWQVFFFIRLFFDFIGHYYDSQCIKAAFFQSFLYGVACIGVFIIPILPSYIAHYLYAFKKPT
ncbi:MAG: hypothetical protein HY209_02430 [Candidatus Omnitrophica bacterium]|nr:hypothetical protein [Candidatus Omnitrophota bacterium]